MPWVGVVNLLLTFRKVLPVQGGRRHEVRCYCRVAVAIRPTSAYAHAILGVALARQGDTDAAIGAYQQALALDPKLDWVL